jgi:hypothetical protein
MVLYTLRGAYHHWLDARPETMPSKLPNNNYSIANKGEHMSLHPPHSLLYHRPLVTPEEFGVKIHNSHHMDVKISSDGVTKLHAPHCIHCDASRSWLFSVRDVTAPCTNCRQLTIRLGSNGSTA